MLEVGALVVLVAPNLKGEASVCGFDDVGWVFSAAGAAAGWDEDKLNIDPEKPPDVEPFTAGVGFGVKEANGLGPPAEKLKFDAVGGVGLKLKPAFAFEDAPKAGNDEFTNDEPGVADCVGGKLVVAPPNMPPFCCCGGCGCCGCWKPKEPGCWVFCCCDPKAKEDPPCCCWPKPAPWGIPLWRLDCWEV